MIMKTKILAMVIAAFFTLGVQANFFDSGHNWNNPFSTMMDSVKEVVEEVKEVATDTVGAVKDVAESTVDKVSDAVSSAADVVDVASLRGTHVLDDLSIAPENFKWIEKNVEFERNYDDQPPLIPHKTAGMIINLKQNKCLSCHSDENYKEEGSPKMSSTHFFTRDDERLPEMSSRRYFCLQCHVPQAKLDPLVESDFVNLD
jgi:nitrate reductase (cytochrome), electron transfer subunit